MPDSWERAGASPHKPHAFSAVEPKYLIFRTLDRAGEQWYNQGKIHRGLGKMSEQQTDKSKSSAVSALLVLGAGCLWGFMGLLVRSTSALGLGTMETCFLRALVTATAMLLLLLVIDRPALKVRLRDLWCFAGTGIVSMTFFNYCYFKTIMLTSLSVAAVLLYTAPVFVVLMSAPLFGEKLSRRKLLAALVAFMGCAFVSGVVGGAGRLSFTGILFGLGSGIGYALYSIFGRYALERGYGSATISFYTFVFALIPTFLLADTGSAVSALTGSLGQFAFLTILILMVTLAPYLLYTKGLQGLENGTASILASIEPVVATLVGLVIYSEKLGIWNILGIVLVLFSILLINRRSTGKKGGPEPDVKA